MSSIGASITKPSAVGRLRPQYARPVLWVGSDEERNAPLGLNIDSLLICDCTAERVLIGFELLVPRRSWKGEKLRAPFPTAVRPGDLVISEESLRQHDFSMPVEVLAAEAKSRIRITFANGEATRLVALSETCVARLSGDSLVGFDVRGIG